MPLILTNDDGIDAPGLSALQQAIDGTGIVVAPQKQHSGCGHQVTAYHPIQVQRRSEREFAIAGTPADCVRVALKYLHPETKLVLSGINAGGNLGTDAYISGTVAAVREAAMHGIPGIAISHYRAQQRPIDWEKATFLTKLVLAELRDRPIEIGAFWNVNLPHPDVDAPQPKIVFCKPCTKPLPVEFKIELLENGEHLTNVGTYERRDRTPNSDVDVCFSGNIAVTKIHL